MPRPTSSKPAAGILVATIFGNAASRRAHHAPTRQTLFLQNTRHATQRHVTLRQRPFHRHRLPLDPRFEPQRLAPRPRASLPHARHRPPGRHHVAGARPRVVLSDPACHRQGDTAIQAAVAAQCEVNVPGFGRSGHERTEKAGGKMGDWGRTVPESRIPGTSPRRQGPGCGAGGRPPGSERGDERVRPRVSLQVAGNGPTYEKPRRGGHGGVCKELSAPRPKDPPENRRDDAKSSSPRPQPAGNAGGKRLNRNDFHKSLCKNFFLLLPYWRVLLKFMCPVSRPLHLDFDPTRSRNSV